MDKERANNVWKEQLKKAPKIKGDKEHKRKKDEDEEDEDDD